MFQRGRALVRAGVCKRDSPLEGDVETALRPGNDRVEIDTVGGADFQIEIQLAGPVTRLEQVFFR